MIDFPSSDFPTHQSPSRQRPDTTESTVSLATVFSMAPGVAAQMILERELVYYRISTIVISHLGGEGGEERDCV